MARKEFLKIRKLCFCCFKKDHTIRNPKRGKTSLYCKGKQNSAICTKRTKNNPNENTNNVISINFVPEVSTILLQTADLIAEGDACERQTKIKVLFDQGSQRGYVTKRVRNFLNLKET